MNHLTLKAVIGIMALLFSLNACRQGPSTDSGHTEQPELDTTPTSAKVAQTPETKDIREGQQQADSAETFRLSSENALYFFKDYAESATENKVEFVTSMGSFTVELFADVPYHRANMIYLARRHYFDTTMFHRVVRGFIIQGGSSDDARVFEKRKEIGLYLLPPDTRKGHRHHRGVISMPSSEEFKSYKKASPYEFFIVTQEPGAYHLDGQYTAFGRVISGMDVVDRINQVEVDQGDWPLKNVYIWSVRAYR